jgi:zinc protease
MDRDQLNRAMAGKTTRLEFQTREDRFSFSGQTVPAEIEVLFQLLYAHLMDPAYRQQAHDQAMNRFSQEYREMESTVEGGMTLYGKRFLAGGDSRFGLPSHAEFTKLSIEDVRSWIDPAIRNAPIELSVVGDFQTDQVIDLADRYFGSLPPRKDAVEKKKTSNHPVFPFGEKLTIRVPTRIFKNLLIVAYPTEDTWNIERARCFSILAEIFSDRLRQQVRENMGAAYSPFAYNRSSRAYPGYGLFQAMVYSEPEKTDAIISEIHKIAEKLASEKIDMDELERVRTPAVNRIQDMVRRNEYWLNSVLSDSRRYPQQIDWSRSLVQTYVSVRPEQLNQLARTYLNLQKAAVFVAGPKMP